MMETEQDGTPQTGPESNANRRRTRLLREIKKQHNWRIQTWAKAELYINRRQAELIALGFDKEELFKPDLEDPNMIDYYANHPYEES